MMQTLYQLRHLSQLQRKNSTGSKSQLCECQSTKPIENVLEKDL